MRVVVEVVGITQIIVGVLGVLAEVVTGVAAVLVATGSMVLVAVVVVGAIPERRRGATAVPE
jgi:hypothetical protein